MIKVEGLTKRFGATTALAGVSFEVAEGQVFGFVGPNGAGKTTTMRILAGLSRPTGGLASVGGVDVSRHPERVRDHIGYMPDFFGVYDRLRSGEYLAFYASCHRIPRRRIDQVVTNLLELVRLPDKRNAPVDTLSRGMKQRLCLARALVHDPSVLLLDEPASGLDPRARAEMRDLVVGLSEMGKTIVLSSHILPELAELCSVFGVIDAGRMVATGPLSSFTVGTARRFRGVVLGDAEQAAARAGRLPGVTRVTTQGDVLELDLEGGEERAGALLGELVAAGIQLSSFSAVPTDLQAAFLQVTGEPS